MTDAVDKAIQKEKERDKNDKEDCKWYAVYGACVCPQLNIMSCHFREREDCEHYEEEREAV